VKFVLVEKSNHGFCLSAKVAFRLWLIKSKLQIFSAPFLFSASDVFTFAAIQSDGAYTALLRDKRKNFQPVLTYKTRIFHRQLRKFVTNVINSFENTSSAEISAKKRNSKKLFSFLCGKRMNIVI